jgi:5-methylcytosine-specific restriction protein A
MTWPFIPNHTYSRRADIHANYGGQQQGGISTPLFMPGIFIFTGHGASIVGYSDAFLPDGSLRYTGQGQRGDMKMVAGNRAIRDHVANGKDLLLFEQTKKGGHVRFLGIYVCAGWEIERQEDIEGVERDAIVFILAPLLNIEQEDTDVGSAPPPAGTLTDQRARAYAATTNGAARTTTASVNIYQRSRDVRDYVLSRAAGTCEGCAEPAPFITSSGRPFLEAHHIRRLSDGGLDSPRHMVGICPNCHRRAHHADDRVAFNATLAITAASIEDAMDAAHPQDV